MPSRGISNFADSDMEDASNLQNENTVISQNQKSPSPVPPKKKAIRGKAAQSRITKSKAAPPKARGGGEAAKVGKKAQTAKRKALEEHVNDQARIVEVAALVDVEQHSAHELAMETGVASEDELESPRTIAQSSKSLSTRGKSKKGTIQPAIAASTTNDENTVRVQPSGERSPIARKERRTDCKQDLVPINSFADAIPETQDRDEQPQTAGIGRQAVRTISRPRDQLAGPYRNETSFRHRAGSASDSERTGDPILRRKLGNVTRKFENIDLKYRNLREVGIVEANTNMEKLRKQCEATTAGKAS